MHAQPLRWPRRGPVMEYEPNPKHKEPWQPGRRGSLCPKMPRGLPGRLLAESQVHGRKRYACHEHKAYCAQEHAPGRWHGYPVSWREVPPPVRRQWLQEGRVTKRHMDSA
jgi:hypothetical protein